MKIFTVTALLTVAGTAVASEAYALTCQRSVNGGTKDASAGEVLFWHRLFNQICQSKACKSAVSPQSIAINQKVVSGRCNGCPARIHAATIQGCTLKA